MSMPLDVPWMRVKDILEGASVFYERAERKLLVAVRRVRPGVLLPQSG